MKTIDWSHTTGSVKLNAIKATWQHMEEAYKESIANFIKGFNVDDADYTTLYGLVDSGGGGGTYNITAGAVYHDGEVFEVAAASGTPGGGQVPVLTLATTYRSGDPNLYSDGNSFNTHAIRRYTITFAASGAGLVDYADLVTLQSILSAYVSFAGVAGGVLSGNYPNPSFASGPINAAGKKIIGGAPGTTAGDFLIYEQLLSSSPPTGPAGGVLSGSYPNPSFASGPIQFAGKKGAGAAPGATAGELVTYEQLSGLAGLAAVSTVTTAEYEVAISDTGNVINSTNTNRRTFTLPLSAAAGQTFRGFIKDASRVTETFPLTIVLQGDDQFENGTLQAILTTNGTCLGFYTDGLGTWYIMTLYGTFEPPADAEASSAGLLDDIGQLDEVGQIDDIGQLTEIDMLNWKSRTLGDGSATAPETFSIGANGGRIYVASFGGTGALGTVAVSDDGVYYHTLVRSTNSSLSAPNSNAIDTSIIPAVMTEAGSELKFYPVGSNAIVKLERQDGLSPSIIVTYVDLE